MLSLARPPCSSSPLPGFGLTMASLAFLSLVVLIPLAALVRPRASASRAIEIALDTRVLAACA